MGTACRALFVVGLLWNVSALGQQPTLLLPDPKLTPGEVFDVTLQGTFALRATRKRCGPPSRH
jgi:hypothetical protein